MRSGICLLEITSSTFIEENSFHRRRNYREREYVTVNVVVEVQFVDQRWPRDGTFTFTRFASSPACTRHSTRLSRHVWNTRKDICVVDARNTPSLHAKKITVAYFIFVFTFPHTHTHSFFSLSPSFIRHSFPFLAPLASPFTKHSNIQFSTTYDPLHT